MDTRGGPLSADTLYTNVEDYAATTLDDPAQRLALIVRELGGLPSGAAARVIALAEAEEGGRFPDVHERMVRQLATMWAGCMVEYGTRSDGSVGPLEDTKVDVTVTPEQWEALCCIGEPDSQNEPRGLASGVVERPSASGIGGPVFRNVQEVVHLPCLGAARLAGSCGHPGRIDTERALPLDTASRKDAPFAKHVPRKDELSEVVTVTAADDDEVDGVADVEWLDRSLSRPLPHGDELADLGGSDFGGTEPHRQPVHRQCVGPVLGAFSFGHRLRACEPVRVVDQSLRGEKVSVDRAQAGPSPGLRGREIRTIIVIRPHPPHPVIASGRTRQSPTVHGPGRGPGRGQGHGMVGHRRRSPRMVRSREESVPVRNRVQWRCAVSGGRGEPEVTEGVVPAHRGPLRIRQRQLMELEIRPAAAHSGSTRFPPPRGPVSQISTCGRGPPVFTVDTEQQAGR